MSSCRVMSFAIVLGRPAQQAEEIDERLRQKTGIAIGGDADDGPWRRFESLVPSGATSSGRCANAGGSAPRASKISTCLKVLVR